MTGIYQIKNLVNNKSYIGLSVDIEKRWAQHKNALNKNRHCNEKLQNAWNKYGVENFQWNILEECEYEKCFDREIYYIQLFNSFDQGYNLTRGGDKGGSEYWEKPVYVYTLQGDFALEFRSRAEAERQLGCHSIKECCLGSCSRGYSKVNQEWYQYSYEYKKQIQPYIFKGKKKEVYQLDETGKILNIFSSGSDACRAVGASPRCHNLRDAIASHKKWKEYYWDYADDYSKDWLPYNEYKILAIDENGKVVGHYKNASDAANKLGLDNSSICKILKGTRCTTGGLSFKKIED